MRIIAGELKGRKIKVAGNSLIISMVMTKNPLINAGLSIG